MVFKNSSSTKGSTTGDDERHRCGVAGGEFKLEKRDLYKERIQQEAHKTNDKLNPEAAGTGDAKDQDMNGSAGSNEQHLLDFFNIADCQSEDFQNLAIALNIDQREMEEEARQRISQEGHLDDADNRDEESLRLMKTTLILEKILANYGDGGLSSGLYGGACPPAMSVFAPSASQQSSAKAI